MLDRVITLDLTTANSGLSQDKAVATSDRYIGEFEQSLALLHKAERTACCSHTQGSDLPVRFCLE